MTKGQYIEKLKHMSEYLMSVAVRKGKTRNSLLVHRELIDLCPGHYDASFSILRHLDVNSF